LHEAAGIDRVDAGDRLAFERPFDNDLQRVEGFDHVRRFRHRADHVDQQNIRRFDDVSLERYLLQFTRHHLARRQVAAVLAADFDDRSGRRDDGRVPRWHRPFGRRALGIRGRIARRVVARGHVDADLAADLPGRVARRPAAKPATAGRRYAGDGEEERGDRPRSAARIAESLAIVRDLDRRPIDKVHCCDSP
jgi:hypothetical protein